MPRDARLRRRNINPDSDSCDSCQYNLGDVCAGFGEREDVDELTFGMPIEDAKAMFPYGCDEYTVSSAASKQGEG